MPLAGATTTLRPGDCRIFLLGSTAGGLRPLVPHVWAGVQVDDVAGRLVRDACAVLADPLAGLTAPSKADRYRAAAILICRWTSASGSQNH